LESKGEGGFVRKWNSIKSDSSNLVDRLCRAPIRVGELNPPYVAMQPGPIASGREIRHDERRAN
jgi:hypothetical protein